MRLGIMQPYFFPYLISFELIARTDRWIVLDVVQYNDHGRMNRNRIQHSQQSWLYINLTVRKLPHGTPIFRSRPVTFLHSCWNVAQEKFQTIFPQTSVESSQSSFRDGL